jgi:hypothetical protein
MAAYTPDLPCGCPKRRLGRGRAGWRLRRNWTRLAHFLIYPTLHCAFISVMKRRAFTACNSLSSIRISLNRISKTHNFFLMTRSCLQTRIAAITNAPTNAACSIVIGSTYGQHRRINGLISQRQWHGESVPNAQRQSTKLIHGGREARIPRMTPELRTAHARFERAGDRDWHIGSHIGSPGRDPRGGSGSHGAPTVVIDRRSAFRMTRTREFQCNWLHWNCHN